MTWGINPLAPQGTLVGVLGGYTSAAQQLGKQWGKRKGKQCGNQPGNQPVTLLPLWAGINNPIGRGTARDLWKTIWSHNPIFVITKRENNILVLGWCMDGIEGVREL